MPYGLFLWLDAHPAAYWAGCIACTLALGAVILAGTRRTDASARTPDWGFALLLLVCLLAWRWPPLLYNQALNPDEPLLIAGAITLTHDPVFWRSVDGATAGPLDFYALLPAHALGLPLGYFSARLTGLLLIWGALLACYRMLRDEYGPGIARLGLLPGVMFFATAREGDFLHYSTEHVPLFLFSLGGCLLWRAHRAMPAAPARSRLWWLAAGVSMGLLPWAKLQAAPLAAALALWGTWLILTNKAVGWQPRRRTFATLAFAALLPSLLFLALIALTGQWEHFRSSYIQGNLAYVNVGSFETAFKELSHHAAVTWTFPALLVTPLWIVPAAAVGVLTRQRRWGALFVTGAIFTMVAAFCVIAPRRGFTHYLLFLVVPLTWWSAAALGEARRAYDRGRGAQILGILYALIAGGIPLLARWQDPSPPLWGGLADQWLAPRDEPGYILHKLRRPEDTLAVWGWHSHLYVESGLPQATRAAASGLEITPSPQRDTYYRPRYLSDFQTHSPAFFADAVGPGPFYFTNRATQGHESFPQLRDYIQAHYVQLAELAAVRLYIRSDLLAQRLPGAADRARLLQQARLSLRESTPAAKVSPSTAVQVGLEGRTVQMLLPPAELTWPLYGTERAAMIEYGLHPRGYTEGDSDGAELIGELQSADGTVRQVFQRFLDPLRRPADRGKLAARVVLPPYGPDSILRFRSTPGPQGNDAWDWVYFSRLKFVYADAFLPEQFPGFNRVPDRVESPMNYRLETPEGPLLMLHAPSLLHYTLQGDERHLSFAYGFQEGAYSRGGQTDGARFVVELQEPGQPARILFDRHLQPVAMAADRGRLQAEVDLPAPRPGSVLTLRIDPAGGDSWDWTYLAALDLR